MSTNTSEPSQLPETRFKARTPMWKRFSATVQTGPQAHPSQPLLQCMPGLFAGRKATRGVAVTNHPHLAPRFNKG